MLHLLLKGFCKLFPSLEKPVIVLIMAASLFYVITAWRERIRFRKKFFWVKGIIYGTRVEKGEDVALVRYNFDGKTYTAEAEYHADLFKKDIGKTVKLALNPENINEAHIVQRSQNLQLWVVTILLSSACICFIISFFCD